MMITRRRTLSLAGLVVVLAALALLAWSRREERDAPQQYRVARIAIATVVRERGTIAPRDFEKVIAGCEGHIGRIGKTGQPVEKGDVLLEMDTSDVVGGQHGRVHDRALLTRNSEHANRQKTEAEIELVKVEESNRLAKLQKELELAELRLAEFREGLSPEELRLLDIGIELAQLRLADARDEYEYQLRLHEAGLASRPVVDRGERAVRSAGAELDERKTTKRIRESGVMPEQVVETKADIARLRALISASRKETDLKVSTLAAKIATHDAEIQRLTDLIASLVEHEAWSTTRADTNGILMVLEFRTWHGLGTRPYDVGMRRKKDAHIANVVRPDAMHVELMVGERDFAKLRENMRARVHIPAYPDRVFEGRLVNLAGACRDRFDAAPWGEERELTGVAVSRADVVFDSARVDLRPGMSALVELLVEPSTERLAVPRCAVKKRGDTFHVQLKGAAGVGDIPVQGYIADDQYFVVTDGLEEGDIVQSWGMRHDATSHHPPPCVLLCCLARP